MIGRNIGLSILCNNVLYNLNILFSFTAKRRDNKWNEINKRSGRQRTPNSHLILVCKRAIPPCCHRRDYLYSFRSCIATPACCFVLFCFVFVFPLVSSELKMHQLVSMRPGFDALPPSQLSLIHVRCYCVSPIIKKCFSYLYT